MLLYYLFLKCRRRRVSFSSFFLYSGWTMLLLAVMELYTPFHWWSSLAKPLQNLVLMAVLLFALGYGLFIGACLQAQKKRLPSDIDIIFVFGAGLFGDRLSLSLKTRLDCAWQLAKRYPKAVIIVSGGQGPDEWQSEASAMKNYLVKRGVDAGRIIMEECSTSTYENLLYSSQIYAFEHQKTALVSNQFHIFRAEKIARRLGIEGYGAAAHLSSIALPVFYTREFFALLKGLLKREI